MTITEVAARVVEQKTAHLLRYRAESVKETGTAQYDAKPVFTGSKRGWIMLDLFTASAIHACHESLKQTAKPETLAKFNNFPIGKLASFCLSNVR